MVGVAIVLAVIALNGPALGNVTFRETGLPVGRPWSVTAGNVTYTSSKDTISVRLLPSTYAFNASLASGTDYVPYPASGHVVVTASGANVLIDFVRSRANVTLQETGLPPNASWAVGEGLTQYSTNATSMAITEPNGKHDLRVLTAYDQHVNNVLPVWINFDLYAPNVSRLNIIVNGSDSRVSVRFALVVHGNQSLFPVHVFPNKTGIGSPAYEPLALTFFRYTVVNFSFHGGPYGVTPFPNATAYLMTASEFEAFAATGNANQYVAGSGNVSSGNWSMTFTSGTWYYVLTGWSLAEYGTGGYSWEISFPGASVYFR